MKTLTGTASYSDSCSFPQDGVDLRRADSLEPSAQQILNNTAFLNSLGLIRKIVRAAGTGNAGTTAFTISSTTYADTGASATVTPAVGDLLLVLCSYSAARTGADNNLPIEAQLTWQSASLAQTQIVGSEVQFTSEDENDFCFVTMIGYATAAFAEAYTIKLQAHDTASGTGDVIIRQNWQIIVFAIKPPV